MSEITENEIRDIITINRRVLDGLAHSDTGKKVDGCKCCYCKGEIERASHFENLLSLLAVCAIARSNDSINLHGSF